MQAHQSGIVRECKWINLENELLKKKREREVKRQQNDNKNNNTTAGKQQQGKHDGNEPVFLARGVIDAQRSHCALQSDLQRRC